MPMVLTAHQPVYLPWLGLLHKIALSDLFCYFDIVQYQRKDFNNRNKINTASGPIWLTVPVKSSGRFESLINDIEIISSGWEKKHIRSIELNYKNTKYYERYMPKIRDVILGGYSHLSELNYHLLLFALDAFSIPTKVVKASDYNFSGKKSDLVLDMSIKLGADIYIFGSQGRDYADVASFCSSGIFPYFQDYNHPIYWQMREFFPNMSFVDLLFNHGESSMDILMSGNISKEGLILLGDCNK